MPKRGVNMHDNEVVRALKTVNDTYIEPISFIVPRRAEMFQDDIYPPTTGLKPAMSAAEWFDGKEALPPKIDLGSLYGGEGLKEVSPLSPPNAAQKHSSPVQQSELTPKEPYPSKPAAVSGRVDTPPSVKEQSSSIAAMASKYADGEETDRDVDDGSSFEEVQKPASSRPPAITFSPPETSEATPSKVVPKVDLPSTDSTAEKVCHFLSLVFFRFFCFFSFFVYPPLKKSKSGLIGTLIINPSPSLTVFNINPYHGYFGWRTGCSPT